MKNWPRRTGPEKIWISLSKFFRGQFFMASFSWRNVQEMATSGRGTRDGSRWLLTEQISTDVNYILRCINFWIIYLKLARESRRRERKNARVGATKKAALFTHFLLQQFTPLGRSSVGSLPGIEMALLLIRTRVIIFWLRCLSGGNCVPRAEFFYALRQSLNFIAARRAKPRA